VIQTHNNLRDLCDLGVAVGVFVVQTMEILAELGVLAVKKTVDEHTELSLIAVRLYTCD
jgi:hypothetical protein